MRTLPARVALIASALLSTVLVPGVASASLSLPAPSKGASTGPTSPLPASLPPARQVFVLGDSLTVGTLQYGDPGYLRSAASAAHLALWPAPSAKVGRRVDEGLAILRGQHGLSTVLVALGTNDWTASSAEASSWVRTVRSLVGPGATIYWVNISMTGPKYAASVARINAGLLGGVRADNARLAASGATGASRVLDWRSFVLDEAIANGSDGIHYPLDGYRHRAAFYVGAITGDPAYSAYVIA
jgi:hypothetical protein